jgi:hypothetical protein
MKRGRKMKNKSELGTQSIRIPTQTHTLVKQKCNKEGRIMGAYVNQVLLGAITNHSKNQLPELVPENLKEINR